MMQRRREQGNWSVPKLWDNEACFIVCGGESVASLDLSRLAGRRVIVINSSYTVVPDADFLLFSDRRWWVAHANFIISTFRGTVVTVTPMPTHPRYKLLTRARVGGLSPDPRFLAVWHTTTCAAINMAVHLGAKTINLLGLDGKGQWHHAPHPFHMNAQKFIFHRTALEALVEPLKKFGVQAFNSNADAEHKMFPYKSYEEMLA